MNNTISAVTITYTVYGPPGPSNQAFFLFLFVVYLSILCVNLFLVLVICVEESLHRPMYILLVSLAINGVIGSSSFCPKIMEFLLVDKQESSLGGCLTQVFFSNFYGCCVYAVLALMAYDRYVSICKPLQYHSIMTPSRLRWLLVAAYLVPSSSLAVQVYLTSRIRLCKHTVEKLLCDNLAIVNLSCEKSILVNVYGLFLITCLIAVPFLLVVLSYIHILTVSLKMSKESQKRALRTCTPHLITFINFSITSFFAVIYNRVSLDLPRAVNVFMSMSFVAVPPLLHPIIYGIKTQEIQCSIHKIRSKFRQF
ncbi:olfactory receptor 51G1-like [Myripristis murdjan]|uniref:olfactory receptor 51G1-like n=1 Tax=Myripristis murdjan TaxID=586833 RepID=UPI001175F60D|nr:olfactory receptor 51G1-like [Myripristis murdjan]